MLVQVFAIFKTNKVVPFSSKEHVDEIGGNIMLTGTLEKDCFEKVEEKTTLEAASNWIKRKKNLQDYCILPIFKIKNE